MELVPICLFVYNRPEHTEKTLEALKENILAKDSILYVFSDGVKVDATGTDKEKIQEVRAILRKKQWCGNVIINESENNKGLAKSIIEGVSKVINEHKRVIVLEDDLITGHFFLNYMNDALIKYESNEDVMQISGYSFPVPKIEKSNSSYFLPMTTTWGWATWDYVWNSVDFECKDYNPATLDKHLFNFYGSCKFTQLLDKQLNNKNVNSWGIRFYFNLFMKKAKILYPDSSLVKNIGWDSSGRHNATFELYENNSWSADYEIKKFPEAVINNYNLQQNIKYLRKENSIIIKIFKKLSTILHIK